MYELKNVKMWTQNLKEYKKTLLYFNELSNILKLTVQEGKRELRNYTFSQLQDLQSRLMLVAGKAEKGSDNVDRFTMVSLLPKIYFSWNAEIGDILF